MWAEAAPAPSTGATNDCTLRAESTPLRLDPTIRHQLVAFRDLLLEWNQRFNLTAVTDPSEVDRRLIGDSLRLLPFVDAEAAALEQQGVRRPLRLIDVGTGAGFPGLALKIARPQLEVTLIEATGKKVTFLRHVIEQLALRDVVAIHGRAEDLAHDPAHRGRYDVATARAVASLSAVLELCVPFLRVGGRALFPKGAELGEELTQGRRAASLLGARILSADLLPGGPDDPVTRLVVAAKIKQTPERYPRRAGIPAKEPLGRVGT